MIAFLDSSALIYLIEGMQPFASKVRRQLGTLVGTDPHIRTAVSRPTWLECRTGPMKSGDTETLATYDAFLSRPDLICVELSAEVVDLATGNPCSTWTEGTGRPAGRLLPATWQKPCLSYWR